MTGISLKTISLRSKIFLSIFLTLVFLGILCFLVIFPHARGLRAISAETQNTKERLEMLKNRQSNRESLVSNYQSVKSQVYLLDGFFISKEDSIDFVDALEKLAEERGVIQNASLLVDASQKKDFYDVIPLRISASGSEESLLNYLADLKQMKYFVNIKHLELSENVIRNLADRSAPAGVGAGRSLLISADTFWLK